MRSVLAYRYLIAALLALTMSLSAAPAGAGAAASAAKSHSARSKAERLRLSQQVRKLKRRVWHQQRVMRVRTSWTFRAPSRDPLVNARAKLAVWSKRAARVNRTYVRPPHTRAWLCIHRGEGSWRAATGNGYYGGLQMSWGFMRHYGAYLIRVKGAANRWSPLEQIWTGEHGRRVQGWGAWPSTSRACGLI
jgi:resuscitation-promoting factor RpfA